jgi:hypothetical protein
MKNMTLDTPTAPFVDLDQLLVRAGLPRAAPSLALPA